MVYYILSMLSSRYPERVFVYFYYLCDVFREDFLSSCIRTRIQHLQATTAYEHFENRRCARIYSFGLWQQGSTKSVCEKKPHF